MILDVLIAVVLDGDLRLDHTHELKPGIIKEPANTCDHRKSIVPRRHANLLVYNLIEDVDLASIGHLHGS